MQFHVKLSALVNHIITRLKQVRCKNTKICSSGGVKVILTDLNRITDTDLALNRPAYAAMARYGMAKELKKLGIVDVEYKR